MPRHPKGHLPGKAMVISISSIAAGPPMPALPFAATCSRGHDNFIVEPDASLQALP
jgi:hypothetical protein